MSDFEKDSWIWICNSTDVPVGTRQEFTLSDGRVILLIRTNSYLVACQADCPHQDTPLMEAQIEGETMTCMAHFWQWSLPSGTPIGIAEIPLSIYQVREDDNGIWVMAKHM